MGGEISKASLEAITHPEDEAVVRKAFEEFDKNKTGGLDRKEWNAFSKFLWEVIVEGATDNAAQEVINQRHAHMQAAFGGLSGGLLGMRGRNYGRIQARLYMHANNARPYHHEAWVSSMFDKADKNKDGNVSFDEFLSFLRNESKVEYQENKDNARNNVLDPTAAMPGPSSLSGALLSGMMMPGMPPEYRIDQETFAIPTGLRPQQVRAINSFPPIKALYATDPETITYIMKHSDDPFLFQKKIGEHPEVAPIWKEFADYLAKFGFGFPSRLPPGAFYEGWDKVEKPNPDPAALRAAAVGMLASAMY